MKGLLGSRQTIEALAALSDLSEADVESVIAALRKLGWQAINYRVAFVLEGFGTFSRRTRKARRITNPKTKQPMNLGETWQLGFRPGKKLRGKS